MKQNLLRAILLLVVFTTAAPLAASARAEEADPPGRVAAVDCPIDVPAGAECGELVVPEDHDAPGGAELRLPYVILRSERGDGEPDPVVFTAGGPGYSSLSSVWYFADSAIREHRDVIVFEQRGNRYATPALTCELSVWWAEVPDHTPCLDSIEARGIDVTHYTAVDIARDLVALRRTLGYEQWNLYGSSFATSVMLVVMDTDPVGSRSAVLTSVKPPHETVFAHESESSLRAIRAMIDSCAAVDECRAAYPDLEARLLSLVRRLNDEPLQLDVEMPGLVDPIPVELSGDALLGWIVVNGLYGPVFSEHSAAYLPLLITQAESGDTGPLERAARIYWSSWLGDTNWAWGLMLAVDCQEDVPAAGAEPSVADLKARQILDGFARSNAQRAICAAWDLPARGLARAEPVESSVPALVLAGSFDPVTPPAWSRATAEHLANATFVEFPGHGHAVTDANPCAEELIAAFIDDPAAALDTACAVAAPGPSFVVPGDLYLVADFARSRDEVSIGDPAGVRWIESLLVTVLLVNLVIAVAIVTLGAQWLLRGRPRPADRSAVVAGGLALAIALSVLALPVLMTAVNNEYHGAAGLGFFFGPRRDLLPATVLAWLAPLSALAAVALAALTVSAWIGGRWRLGLRLGASLAVAASVAMAVLGERWDLYGMLV